MREGLLGQFSLAKEQMDRAEWKVREEEDAGSMTQERRGKDSW